MGSGGGGLIAHISRIGYECIASDVTDQRADLLIRQFPGLRWLVADAIEFSNLVTPASQNAVVSDQVVEHLHPDDVPRHLEATLKVLRPEGRYILRVPHALAGPGDVSQVFGAPVAMGMHLKEYTYHELQPLALATGFGSIRAFFIWSEGLRKRAGLFRHAIHGRAILAYLKLVESLAQFLPFRLGRTAFLALTLSKNVCLILHKAH